MDKNQKKESRGKQLDVKFRMDLHDNGNFRIYAKRTEGEEKFRWSNWEDLQKAIRELLRELGLVVRIGAGEDKRKGQKK